MRPAFAVALALAAVSPVALAPAPAAAQEMRSALPEIQKRGQIRIGWATWFPYAFKDPATNQISGITADVMKSMAEWLKVEVVWVEDSWGTMIAGLQAGKFDMLMPMGVTLPRALAVTYTDPFMQSNLGLMVRKEDESKYKTWQDVDKAGLTVTTALGSNSALYAKRVFQNAKVIEMKAEADSYAAVIARKADAVGSTYDSFQKAAVGRDQLVIVPGAPYAYSPTAFVVRQGDFLMRDWMNHFLAEMKADGTMVRIAQKHGLDENSVK